MFKVFRAASFMMKSYFEKTDWTSSSVKKKITQDFTSIHIVVAKAFYIDGLIYERKLIGSVTHCSEFKMLMKSTPYTLYMSYLFKLPAELSTLFSGQLYYEIVIYNYSI